MVTAIKTTGFNQFILNAIFFLLFKSLRFFSASILEFFIFELFFFCLLFVPDYPPVVILHFITPRLAPFASSFIMEERYICLCVRARARVCVRVCVCVLCVCMCAYWTTLNTSSLLHRQDSANPHCDRINGPRVCVGRAERKVHQGQPVVACACGNRGGSIGQYTFNSKMR